MRERRPALAVGIAIAAVLGAWVSVSASHSLGSPLGRAAAGPRVSALPDRGAIAELRRTVRPSRPVVRRARVVVGRSAEGRPITATAANGLGMDGHGGGPLVLVIGCIHGDECAGIKAAKRSDVGRPPYGDGLVVVPNVNPDGLAARTRLNAHGVDLNRNFSEGWQLAGLPWDPEYSGPRPFSEPEARVARRLIRGLRPDVTIWFHQQEERLVRAWGPSVPAARTYARLAGEPFRRMPWLSGTAPNWQNHRFPGTSSFVVELPLDGPAHTERHAQAIWRLANEL